jgi:hypothetical protein
VCRAAGTQPVLKAVTGQGHPYHLWSVRQVKLQLESRQKNCSNHLASPRRQEELGTPSPITIHKQLTVARLSMGTNRASAGREVRPRKGPDMIQARTPRRGGGFH